MSKEKDGYILVDLDRTLAKYESWEEQKDAIGEPIPLMLERVQRWLHFGYDVRLFTARASRPPGPDRDKDMAAINEWCTRHLGRALPVQNWKCFRCIAIWDDIAVTVEANTGWRVTLGVDEVYHLEPLDPSEEKHIFNIDYQRTQTKKR